MTGTQLTLLFIATLAAYIIGYLCGRHIGWNDAMYTVGVGSASDARRMAEGDTGDD